MTNPVQNTNPSAAAGTPAAPRSPANELGQEQFFELMITQLKNQDPLKPMQNGEFLAQLAQFSTVKGIQNLQDSFTQFSAGMQSAQALQASSLVGRSVLLPGDSVALTEGGSASGAVNLTNAASAVTIEVLDPSGQVVDRIELGAQPAGQVNFTWDGKTAGGSPAPAGAYSLRAQATSGGKDEAVATLIAAKVESVSLGGPQGLLLNLAGYGSVALTDIRQIM